MYIVFIFTVPSPVIEVTSIDAVEFGKPATLQCNVIELREIARSRVDIIWMTQFSTVKRINDVKANIISNSTVYNDYLVTTPLSVNDNSIVYYCGVSINTPSGVHFFNGSIVIDFNSKFCTCVLTYSTCVHMYVHTLQNLCVITINMYMLDNLLAILYACAVNLYKKQ